MSALLSLAARAERRDPRWWLQPVASAGTPTEPITLAEAKTHLRVDYGDDDNLISGLITGVRVYVENFLQRSLVNSQSNLYLTDWPRCDRIQIPRAPLSSIDGFFYTDSTEVEQTISPTLYVANATLEPPEVVLRFGQTWPSATLSPSSPIRILFTAGYGTDAESVPRPIRQAMLLVIGHLFKNREEVVAASGQGAIVVQQIPMGAIALLEGSGFRNRLWK